VRVRTLLRLSVANLLFGAVVITFVPPGAADSDRTARPLPQASAASGSSGDRVADEELALLRARLDAGSPDVRMAAVRALSRRGDAAALRVLEGLRRDRDPVVRRAAVLSLADHSEDPRRLRALLVGALCDGPGSASD
jgi:HEAT repeat protein